MSYGRVPSSSRGPGPRHFATVKILGLIAVVLIMLLVPFPAASIPFHPSAHPAATIPQASSTPDFNLTANPDSLAMTPGSTRTTTITAKSENGFSGTIYLSTFAYPLAVSLNPTSLTLNAGGSASSILTINVPVNAPPGDSLVFVGAVGGCTLFHFTEVSVTINAPDFTLTAQKTQLTVPPGGSDTSVIDLASQNGFSGAVSISSFSFQFTVTLSNPSVTLSPGGTGSTTLTVQADPSIESGNYSLTLSGQSGNLYHSADLVVTVPGPTFAMSTAPEFLTLLAGGPSNSSTVTITPVEGFSGTVTLTDSPSFPSGIISSLNTHSVNLPPTQTSVLTVSAPPGLSPGFYSIEITGDSSSITKSANVIIQVKAPDFEVSADPSFLAVVAGGPSCTSTISVTGVNGFTGTVTLTKSASQGLITTISTSSVTVPGTSTLTISAASGMVPGVYSVEVNGTRGTTVHSTVVDVLVIGPDFDLSSNPSSLTIVAGQSGTSTISLNNQAGFSDVVSLAASSFDSGITASVNPGSMSGTETSTLTVSVAAGTLPGSYYSIEVSGTSGALSHSLFIPITVVGPDFSLNANPASLTIDAGSSATSTITIVPILGFSDPVDLFASPSSFDLTAAIDPATVTSNSYTATLTVSSTVPGDYTVDILGSTSSGLDHSFTIPVRITGPDYTLAANPVLLTIAAGSSSTATIAIHPTGGFTGTVDLSASSPLGITATPSPPSITGSEISTLTITVNPATLPGPYTIDIQGTSGSLTRDVSITVNVAGFSLTANPDTLTVAQGATQPSTITVASENGFGGTVQLTANAPTGLTATLDTPTITGSGTAHVSITASSIIIAGTYSVDVTGTSGQLSQTSTITVTVPTPDFGIAPSAATTVPCTVDTNCDTTITITAQNGFSGTVDLTVSPATGLTCNTPASISGFGVATLTCSASSPGDYEVTITGTSGTLIHSTGVITYHVVAGPDFSISAGTVTPSSILAGGSGTVTITVNPVNSFTGPITFEASPSTPSGLNCTSIPNWTGTGSISVTCNAAAAGDYTVIVMGTAMINGSPVSRTTGTVLFHVVDFAVRADPTTVTVNTYAAGTSTITITAENQFSGTVSLSVDNSACSLSSNSVTDAGTSTLSCTFTAPGTLTVTITGTSTVSRTAIVTFTVNASPDFTISTTTPVSFTSGSTATSTVSVAAQYGFYSSVDLAYTVSPSSGLIVSVSPQSITYGTGTSTAALTSSTPGIYTVTITGTSGTIHHDATVIVTVVSPVTPDFDISANPTTLSIQAGNSGTSTVTINPRNGFTDNVAFTTTSPTTGITATLSSSSTSSGSLTSTLTINVDSSAPAGTYTVTVRGTSGSLSHDAVVTITVTAALSNVSILGLSPTTIYASLGAIIAIIIIAAAVLTLRRRPKTTKK